MDRPIIAAYTKAELIREKNFRPLPLQPSLMLLGPLQPILRPDYCQIIVFKRSTSVVADVALLTQTDVDRLQLAYFVLFVSP